MKRAELKRLIKPIVQECIQESLLEDGVLSRVISEVMMGLAPQAQLVSEDRERAPTHQAKPRGESEVLQQLKQQRHQMLDSIGTTSYNGVNLFEGTDPLSSAGTPGEAASPTSPLSGIDARDPGVDISSLAGVFGNTWKAIGNG